MNARRLVFAGCWLALLAVGLRLAWIGDDACITLRTVENCVLGEGLRWNVADRVQTFTHPSWMLLLLVGRWCGGDPYVVAITLGLVASTAAVALLLRAAGTVAAMLAVATLLLGTRAFGDYMTSGLETPLVCCLLAVFARARRTSHVVAVASLLTLTRLDLALLALPATLAAFRGERPWPLLRTCLVAGAPLLAWLVFATVYFGSALPVTAHAKAFGLGIPAWDIAQQGLRYAWFAVVEDPLLLVTVGFGLLLGLRQPATRWLAFGALLYVGYVVKVGGDFMAGRFFVPPFVVAVTVIAAWLRDRGWRSAAACGIAAGAVAALGGVPAWLRPPAADVAAPPEQIEAQHGIVDERCQYYPLYGLFAAKRAPLEWGAFAADVGPRDDGKPWILAIGAVGGPGFRAGRVGHLVDPLLCDPLLARLPAHNPMRWRVGHVLRRVPEGYFESLASGENRIVHPGLRAYWGALRSVTRDPLFAAERWSAMWQLASGALDDGLRAFVAEHYHTPPRVTIAASELPAPLPLGAYWFDEPRTTLVYGGGIAITWGAPQTATTLRLQALSDAYGYRCSFVRDGQVRGDALGAPTPPPPGLWPLRAIVGLRELVVDVPASAGAFDTVWIDLVATPRSAAATGPMGIGALTLVR